MTLFERVKEISKKRGYSLAETSQKAGLGQRTLYQWKENQPSADRLKAVADVLGVSVDYLLGNTDETMPARATGDQQPVDIEKALDNAVAYGGKPMTDNDRMILKGLIEAYLSNKEG